MGPILVVEDDLDNHYLFERIFRKLNIENEIKFFSHGKEALKYLKNTKEKPYMIFSDINMPVMDGIEFKAAINQDTYLRLLSVPFIFLSTSISDQQVKEAYALNVQGFFDKGCTFEELKRTIKVAMEYWKKGLRPC